MWLGYFAAVLQVILILERILNRMVSLFVTTNRSDTKKLADNTVVGSVFSSTLTIFTMPIQAASVFLQLIFSNIYFFIAICLVAGTVIIINDNASLFMVNFVNVYNSGLGQVVNSLIQQLSIVDLIFRSVVPLYNGLVWFVTRWVWHVLYPFINSESGYLPTLIENLTLLCGSFAISLQTWITHIITCVSGSGGQITSALSSNVTVPFVPAAVQCYGNANYLMLDLMTPSTYFVQIVKTIKQILLNTCMPAGLIMEIGAYPFLDYNTYKMVHSTINFILNLFVGLPVSTYQRCQYGKSSAQFSVVEQNVMCTPDFSVSHAMLVTVYRSAGKMIDNWFNVILALSQNVFTGANYKCVSYSPFTRINDNATSIFLTGPDGIKTVGVTSQMIAVTDGNSTGYHHLSEKKYTEWAVGNWPFAVNPRYGIASIRYGETFDGDQHGELRTGLFGCNCYDMPDSNNAELTHMQVLCAGVPYNSFTDNETEYYASTVHPVNFYSSRTAGYMTCAKTRIKVSSMRFSRKRFSETHAFGIEGSFLDAFDSMGLNGARDPLSFTADASVHIQPLCDGTDASCVPNIENCYPWCLGIHSAGMTASNITMFNARTWEETVRLGQVDCVVKSGQLQICDEKDKTQVINEDFGLNLQGPCVSDFPFCEADDFSATFLSYEDSASGVNPLQNTSLYQHKKNVYPLVRLEEQPFVAVGDVMLHVNDCQLVVTRLYNDNHGYFQLDNEMLTMSSNWNAPFIHFDDPSKMECIQDFGCEVEADANGNVRNLDPTCYSKAVKQGRFILPRSYFATNPIEAPAALSEWGVHWAVNPENSIFEAQFEWCRSGARKSGATVLSSYSKARIWTMKTVRAVDTVNFGIQDTRSMSYMVVPDWLEWRENPTTVDCDNMVNLKVLDLEYINDQNILVTVLTAPPSTYMHDTVDWPICVGCPYTLTYYYLHPTRQDCIEPEESDDAHFSCWRRESEGMFTNSEMDDQTTVGELCPELRRLPEIGAAAGEIAVAGVHALKMVVDLVTVLPVVGSSFDEIFDTRLNHINFHHILDGGAQALFKVDPVVNSVQKSAMLVAHGLPKLGEFFKGSEEYELMQPVLMGTAKVLQHSYVPLTGIFLQQFNTINKIPLAGIGKSRRLLQLPAAESNVRDESVNKKAKIPSSVKNIWRQMSQFVGYTKYIGRIFSDLLRKMARSTLSLRNQNRIDRFARTQVNNVIKTANVGPRIVRVNLPVASVATVETLLFSTIYDLQHDFRRTFLDNVRVQCHGVGQIFGAGKPWGSLAKHSCMLIADSAQSVMNALLVLTIEYSVLHCICKLPEEDNMLEVIQARCLPQFLPMSFRNWVLDLIRNQNGEVLSECFAIMDTSNRKLETAIDPLIRRFELIIPHIANSLDYFMTFFGMDAGKCDSFIGNPSLVTIMPQPVDWFMGCGGTSYCRMRCYDSIMSFEDELARLAEGGSTPFYSESVQVDVQSRFFSENKLINGIDLPPFAIYGMTELRLQACATVCGSSHSLNRCVAIAGFAAEPTITNTSNSSNFNAMGRLQSAYYCVPSNFMNPVYEHQMQTVLYEDEVLKNTQVLHIEFITHDQVMENKHEHLLVTGKNLISDDFSMWMFTHDGQAFDVFKTSPDGVVLYPDMLELTTIRHVHVIPGSQTTLSTVYVIGQRLMGDNSLQDACLKMTFYDMTNIPAMIQFAKDGTQFCTDYMDTIYSPQSKFVCVDELCNTFFKIPYQSSDADEIEEFTFDVTTESRSLERRYQIQQNALSSLSNVFNIDPEYPLLLSATGMPTLNTKFMSTYSPRALGQNSVGVKRVSILIAGRLNDRAWLFNAEITLQADSYYTASLGSSMTVSQQVKFLDKCSIQNCMACQSSINSHLFRDLQHKCYAASECALVNCVGTKIDVRKPLCNIGSFISGQLALASVSTQGLWMALSHTVITLVELSAARREQYAILWPQETFVSTMCVLKDTIAVQAATMTSVATAVTSMDNPETVQDYDTAIDSNAGARQILYSISLTEVITSIMMFPVYLAIALENSIQCSLTSLMTSVSNVVSATDQIGLSGDEFEVLVLSSQEYNARTDRIAGQCLQEANPASMSELSMGKTKTELSEILTSVLSNMADMIVSVQFDPIFSLFNSFLSYTEGITISLYSLIQIVDWEDCKMSTIYTMSPASCTCGDKAMSIPHEQKKRPAAVTPSNLWCVGPLLLTDAMGADLLVWNPYSLEELLQNDYDLYLECRSKWLRFSDQEIDSRAQQLAETEMASINIKDWNGQIDREIEVMIEHIYHDALQMSILIEQCKSIDDPDWEDYNIPSQYENDVGNALISFFTQDLGLASRAIQLFTKTRKSTFSCTNFKSLGEGSFRSVREFSAQEYYVRYMKLLEELTIKMTEISNAREGKTPVFSDIIHSIKSKRDFHQAQLSQLKNDYEIQKRLDEAEFQTLGGRQSCDTDVDCNYKGCTYENEVCTFDPNQCESITTISTECSSEKVCVSIRKFEYRVNVVDAYALSTIDEFFLPDDTTKTVFCPKRPSVCPRLVCIDHGPIVDEIHKRLEYTISTALKASWINVITNGIGNKCDALKVENEFLLHQGVEVMQVVTKCRTNYHNKEWDRGSLLLGLYSFDELRNPVDAFKKGVNAEHYMSAYESYYKKFKFIAHQSDADLIRLSLDDITHQCLYLSISAGNENHMCMEQYFRNTMPQLTTADQYFQYEPLSSANAYSFVSVDACQAYSGSVAETNADSGASNPKLIWSSKSANNLGVANLHIMNHGSQAEREAAAEERLKTLITNEIEPELAKIPLDLSNQIEISAWSVEGDEIHQLVDCVIMGPYAAADMHSTFTMSNGQSFPVPQYHRGDPGSRAFVNDGLIATKGSEARKEIMKAVQEHIAEQYDTVIMEEARGTLSKIKYMFKDVENMKCFCAESFQPSLACCSEANQLAEIDFKLNNLFANIYALTDYHNQTWSSMLDSTILRDDLWTTEDFTYASSYQFNEAELEQLKFLYVFNTSTPVREYSKHEVVSGFTQETLWSTCTSLLSSSFFTLPIKTAEQVAASGGSDFESMSVDADMAYDPASENADNYLHGMERVIGQILTRARQDSPVFWTHVNRYIPSDSVWCEDVHASPHPETLERENIYTPPSIKEVVLQDDTIYNQSLNETLFVADIPSRCFCNWHDGTACVVPACYELVLSSDLQAKWQALCTKQTYTSRQDLFTFMQAIEESLTYDPTWFSDPPSPYQSCPDVHPSTAWGLMDTKMHGEWYNESDDKQYVNTHELATYGPAGLRIKHLSESPNFMHDFVGKHNFMQHSTQHARVNYKYGHTIGQPYCEKNRQDIQHANLSKYFRDVFFPMAHSVYEAPASAHCSTWAIEHAIEETLYQILDQDDPRIAEQHDRTRTWKARCDVQLQQIGICLLRGVYDIVPVNTFMQSVVGIAVVVHDDASFDRTQLDKIDVGPRTWNIANNGGFTAVMKVKFEGSPNDGKYQNLFRFFDGTARINIDQNDGNSDLRWVMYAPNQPDGRSVWCNINSVEGLITYNTWHTVVLRWRDSDKMLIGSVDNTIRSVTCTNYIFPNLVTNPTWIGGIDGDSPNQHFNGQLAGFYAFDRYLDDTQVALVADNIKIPFDMSTAVVAQDDASFDRTQLSQIDLGPRTWNIASNGGLTIVTKLYPTSNFVEWEDIFRATRPRITGTAETWDVLLYSHTFRIFSNNWQMCSVSYQSLARNTWTTLIARYNKAENSMSVNIDPPSSDGTTFRTYDCDDNTEVFEVGSFTTTKTSIGGDGEDPTTDNFNGQLAGLYAFDRYLDDTEVALVAANIQVSTDVSATDGTDVSATDGTDVRLPDQFHRSVQIPIVPEHCLFTIGNPHGCESSVFYVIPQNCLVMCDGAFYDPCSSVSARESAPTDEYELVEEGGRYRLVGDSTNNPTLKMARGRQTRVRWPSSHPFTVSDTSGYGDTPSELMHLNADSHVTIVNVPKNVTGPLYYYCSQHSSMYGVIEIVDAEVEVSHNCSDVVFMKSHTKPIQDPRHFAEHHAVKLYSMHWPESIDEAEAPGAPATRVLNAQVLNDQLRNIKQRLSEINFENYDLYESIKHLIERNDIDSELEHPVHSDYCDDLLDYFDATAQHPVGYHPTPASDVDHTNMRGFDSWMSQSDEYAWLLDPVRLRNMSLYSNHFGASHLTCDASVYGAMGINMNPYYLQTKWDPTQRVDPAVNLNKVDPVMDSFTEIGVASEDGFDTPLTNDDGFMRHSVGLIRDWNRWYGDDPGFLLQLAHDEEWPHWTDCTECDTYGLEADEPMLDCPMPPLYTCTRDADCDGPDQDLMCLKNAYIDPQTNEVSEHGICSKASTCYQHDHCLEGFMCSGAGTCVVPRIFVTNYLETDISAQLFAEQTAARDTAQCTESMNGMSAFQNIPDFAQSHGQCSFRNWVHYTNLTRGEDIQSDGLKHIQNRDVRRSDSDVQQNLYQDLNLLRPMPTICDMDYQHTQYKFCNPSTFTALNGFGAGLQTMCRNPAVDGKCFLKAVKPWTNLDSGVDQIRVRMCDLYDEYSTVSGLLSPYKYIDDNGWEQDTLDHVTSTLKRCSEFEICPELEFLVQGRGVERRQVLKVEFDNQAQEYDFKSTETRAYSHSDAEDCFGFGYHPEDSDTLCVVDRYTLPIIDALFNTDEAVMNQHLPINTYETTTSTQWSREFRETLFHKLKHGSSENDREKCPHAFSVEIEGRVDQDLFDHFFKALTRTYKISSRDTVKKYANYLLPALFGIHPETGLNRGISNIDDYVQHASCLLWISSALSRSRTLASRTNEMPYTVESIYPDKVPGDSLYIFRDRAAVALDMAWFWKCVVLADPSIADGGVRRDWLEVLSNHDSEENDLTCANYDTTPNAEMTLKKRLQTAGGMSSAEVFVRYDMYSDIDNTVNILNDINTVIKFALNELRLGAIPHIYCMMAKKIDIEERNDCLNVFLEYSDRVDGDRCWTKYGIDLTEIGSQTQSFVKDETTDLNSLYFKAQELLLGTAAGGEDLYNRYATYTLANLLETGKLTEIDHNLEDIVRNEDTFFPVYSFTYIKDNMETPPDVSFLELTSLEDFETVLTASYATKVSQGHACWHRANIPLDSSQENVFHITEPEFEVTDDGYVEATAGYTTGDDRLLTEEHNYHAPLIGRRYVSQEQALYLMLRVIKREIYNTISFRDGNLYLDSFKSGQSFPDFGIDLQNSLQAAKTYNDFMRKRTKACKDDKRMVLNVETNTAHRRLRNCVANMNQNIGWLIDAYDGSPGVVQIEVPSDILMNGFYLSFMERVAGDLFLDDITNSKWVNSKHTAAENLVCYQTYEGNAIPLNPLWAGNFDVVTCPAGVSCGCDTRVGVSGTRYVDAKCKRADDEQPCEELFPDMFNFIQNHCKELSQAYTATSMPNMGSLKETYTPLCQRQFDLELSTIENDEETCRLQHGTFHGHKGNRMQDLIYSQHTALDSNERGLWKQSNSIFRSRRYQPVLPTSIHILNTDIAGHALEFSVDKNAQLYLRCVYTMPTERQTPNQESDATRNQCTHSSGKWMDSVESAFKWQHNVLENAWPTPVLTSTEVPWKCPLQWMTAYSNSSKSYAARVPNRDRNRIRFHHITSPHTSAHPLVSSVSPMPHLRPARFMADNIACARYSENGKANCQGDMFLQAAIQSLLSNEWTPFSLQDNSLVLGAQNCEQVLDWPHQAFTTRDQKKQDSEYEETTQCNVLGRLPPFAMRFTKTNNRYQESSTPVSVLPGGVCHMARLKRLQPWHEVCVENNIPCDTESQNSIQMCRNDNTHLTCKFLQKIEYVSNSNLLSFLDVRNITIKFLPPHKASKFNTTLSKSKLCSAHQKKNMRFKGGYTSRFGDVNPVNQSRDLMSVGLPMKLSTERLIAQYIRNITCPVASDEPCSEMKNIFNLEQWTSGLFLNSFMSANDTAGLIKNWKTNPALATHLANISFTDDQMLWERNWVFCDQAAENNQGCNGSVSKQDWIDPAVRPQACKQAILESKTTESLPVHFCLLDQTTQRLCERVVYWNSQIKAILCQAAGLPECPETNFFYTPSTYILENRQFVSETVFDFYESLSPSACVNSISDELINAQTSVNQKQLTECDATIFISIKSIVQDLRRGVRGLYDVFYHTMSAITYFILTFITLIQRQDYTYFVTQFFRHLSMCMEMYFQTIVDFVLVVLTQIPGFDWIVKILCSLISSFSLVLCGLATVITETATAWTHVVDGLANVPFILTSVLVTNPGQDISVTYRPFLDPLRHVINEGKNFICNTNLKCPKLNDVKAPPAAVHLTATRCWPTYTTFFGDNDMLSCSAGDTCRKSRSSIDVALGDSQGEGLIMCGQCDDPLPTMYKFDCDTLTKMCTCSIPKFTQTSCMTNADCQLDGASCAYINNEFETRNTFTDCAACSTQKVCFKSPGAEAGVCSCSLRSIPFSTCTSDNRGQVMIPDPNKFCLYENERLFGDVVASSSSFSRSMSISCADVLDQTTVRCRFITDFNGFYMVSQPGFGGRRLLSDTQHNLDSSITRSTVCKDALNPKNELILVHAKQECVKAYHTSLHTIQMLNLTGKVHPCTFCSMEDFKYAAWESPSLLIVLGANAQFWSHIGSLHGPGKHVSDVYHTAMLFYDVIQHDIKAPKTRPKTKVAANTSHYSHPARNLSYQESYAKFEQEHFNSSNKTTPHRKLLTFENIADALRTDFEASTSMHESFASQFSSIYNYRFPELTQNQKVIWFSDWPPSHTSESLTTCNVLSDTLTLADWAVGNTTLAYTPEGRNLRNTPKKHLRDAWPRIPDRNESSINDDTDEDDTIVYWFVRGIRFVLSWISLESHDLYNVFAALMGDILEAGTCDYTAIQTCSKWYVTLTNGFIVTTMYFSLWFILCSVFQLTFVATLTVPLFAVVLMWVCYGYSPLCVPLIPVCAMEDLHTSLSMIFPKYMRLPLSIAPNCPNTGVEGGAPYYSPACVQDCRQPPFEYDSWHAVVAWISAEFGPSFVDFMLDNVERVPFIDHNLLMIQLEVKNKIIQDENGDLLAGNRVCVLLSSYYIMPYLMIAMVAFLAAVTVVRLLFSISQPISQLLASLYVSIFTKN